VKRAEYLYLQVNADEEDRWVKVAARKQHAGGAGMVNSSAK